MKISILSLTLFFGLLLPSEGGSFARDVMGKSKPKSTRPGLDGKLLELAIPLEEYKKKINAKGLRLGNDGSRHLEEDYVDDYNNNDGEDEEEEEEEEVVYENEDDYYVNEYNYVNYTGYSFKYAKCQPVQRFSQSAVEAGEYSPMVINDIVILRLCDSMYCSDSRGYGCNTDYVEYAIELTDYIRVMLRYEMDRKDQLCDWCDLCISGKQDQRRAASTKYYYTYDDEGNLVVNEEYVDDDDFWSNLDCSESDSYCYDSYGYSICGDGDDDSSYMGPDDYLDIIDCTQVDGGYFIRPRCDAYSETLTMGVYHDKFCTHYAGNEVSIEYFNLGINQTYFQQYGKDAGCQDCSESDVPPYFNSNSNLCNRLDVESARCTSSTTNELFVNSTTTTSYSGTQQCSFMDSVRYGTYDADGKLSINSSSGIRQVTNNQKWLLVLSMSICGILAIYSCYLHHAITNMLIKSLSHTDLLPPSKYRRRSNSSGARRKGGRRSRKPVNNDEDEDEDFAIKTKEIAMA